MERLIIILRWSPFVNLILSTVVLPLYRVKRDLNSRVIIYNLQSSPLNLEISRDIGRFIVDIVICKLLSVVCMLTVFIHIEAGM